MADRSVRYTAEFKRQMVELVNVRSGAVADGMESARKAIIECALKPRKLQEGSGPHRLSDPAKEKGHRARAG
jgi:hypothetical protein